jgi:murein tripeptide amidase MpaA
MNFNRYFTNEEIEKILKDWSHSHPDLATLNSIGESYQKLPIWLLTLTNTKKGADIEKPAVWLDANIHATEISGTTTLLRIADKLIDGYGKDDQATRLLDNSVYYIVPRVNPDGAALALADYPQYVRSGVRPYPWPEKEEGLHEEDIDKDGRILQMRIPDPNGDWKISSLDPRLLEKRSPTEVGGNYYRLLPEGRMEKFDGYTIKIADPFEGLDFNRNFPFEWRGEDEQQGAGPYPVSEAETRALVDFLSTHKNINLAITYHTFCRVILRCYSTKSDEEMETSDLWVYKKIGQIGSDLTGYRCVSTFHDFKYHPKEITTGGFDDWLYDQMGIFAFTIELWDLPTEAGIKDRKFIEWFRDHPHEDDLKILNWADAQGKDELYVPWYEFDHPQLGKIELGGWNQMYSWRNPPLAFIGAEAERNTGFALALGDLLPKLTVHSLEITPIGQQNWHINLVVENSGFLPTYTSEQGKKRKSIRPVRVELEIGDRVEIVNGRANVELSHLEGRSNKLDPDSLWGSSPTDNRARVEWVVKGKTKDKITIHISSERAGTIHRKIELP